MSEDELIKETMMLDYSQLVMNNVYCHKEIERLNNIIKEVRENINKKLNVNSDYVDYDFGTELLRQELLEILDKGE